MKRILITGPLVLATLTLSASPAFSQGLRDRIDHVRQERAATEARNTDKGRLLSVLLYRDIDIEFRDQRARDVINYMQNLLGVPIIGRWMDDRVGRGLDPDALVTLSVQRQPALRVLEMILEQLEDFDETTWQLRDGFIEVGTKDRLASRGAQEIRYYPIRDLLFEPPRFDNAPQFDLNQALQQGGGAGGGGGGGGGRGGGGGGGGGGGSGGGGGGGGLFGAPGADPELDTEEDRAREIIDLIVEVIEPIGWDITGGTWATIRYHQGVLIVRGPDFIHRQLAGYPYRTSPAGIVAGPAPATRFAFFGKGSTEIVVAEKVRPNIGDPAAGKEDGASSPGDGA